ncbi:uncharacterized protein A1O9_03601, partial [Exophiala aquamarina CBS 119918]
SFTFRETHYPLPIASQVRLTQNSCQTWKVSLNSMQSCMQETCKDCHFYEQNQFAMYTGVQILFFYRLPGDHQLPRNKI